MPWQVIVENVNRSDASLNLNCVITDGVSQKFEHSFVFASGATLESVKATIQQYLDALSTNDTLAKQIQPGVLDLTPVEGQPQDPPPAKAWQIAFGRLVNLKQLVDLGVITTEDAVYADQLKTVTNTFDPTFI